MQPERLRRRSNKGQSSFCHPLSCLPRSARQWIQVGALSSTCLSILAGSEKLSFLQLLSCLFDFYNELGAFYGKRYGLTELRPTDGVTPN